MNTEYPLLSSGPIHEEHLGCNLSTIGFGAIRLIPSLTAMGISSTMTTFALQKEYDRADNLVIAAIVVSIFSFMTSCYFCSRDKHHNFQCISGAGVFISMLSLFTVSIAVYSADRP